MSALPDEILLDILSLVPNEVRVTCLRVCAQWRRVGLDRSLWRGDDSNPVNLSLQSALLLEHARRGGHTAHVTTDNIGFNISITIGEKDSLMLAIPWLAKGILGPIAESCVLTRKHSLDVAIILNALHGTSLRRLEWKGTLDVSLIRHRITSQFPNLELLSLSEETNNYGGYEVYFALLSLRSERLVVKYDHRGSLCPTNKEYDDNGFIFPTYGLISSNLVVSEATFTPTRFPLLRVLRVGSSEHMLFGDYGSPPPLLEELALTIDDDFTRIRQTYPLLRRLSLTDWREDAWKLSPLTAAQVPLLEEIIYCPPFLLGEETIFNWWASFIDPQSGPPHLRTIALDTRYPVRHATTCYVDVIPEPVDLEPGCSVTHLMPNSNSNSGGGPLVYQLTITLPHGHKEVQLSDDTIVPRAYLYSVQRL